MSPDLIAIVVFLIATPLVVVILWPLFFRKPKPVRLAPEWFQAAERGEVIHDPARRQVHPDAGFKNRRGF